MQLGETPAGRTLISHSLEEEKIETKTALGARRPARVPWGRNDKYPKGVEIHKLKKEVSKVALELTSGPRL